MNAYIYLLCCARSQLQHAGYLVVECELLVVAYGIQFPEQRLNPGPLHWENRVLASRSPGKSLHGHSYASIIPMQLLIQGYQDNIMASTLIKVYPCQDVSLKQKMFYFGKKSKSTFSFFLFFFFSSLCFQFCIQETFAKVVTICLYVLRMLQFHICSSHI